VFLGLRTVIYPMADLDAGKEWFRKLLSTEPNFDESYYVGFTVAGYELGLVPKGGDGSDGEPITYWGVASADRALAALVEAGATLAQEVTDVGESIRVAAVREPNGNLLGVIENPHFATEPGAPLEGPGR
jgi:predicted enzyme related to lactoylglutathione lyase